MDKIWKFTFLWILFQGSKSTIGNFTDGEDFSKYQMDTTIPHNTTFCRGRDGYMSDDRFKILSCLMCYKYLFAKYPTLKSEECNNSTSGSDCVNHSRILYPTIDDNNTLDIVCKSLDKREKCQQWTSCCRNAWKCCKLQKIRTKPIDDLEYCPQKWDGWACWDFTKSGDIAKQSCPAFLTFGFTEVKSPVTKKCTSNGTWYVKPDSGKEWADYTDCVPGDLIDLLEVYKQASIITIAFNSISIVLLVPAISIFLFYRQLRNQQRIKIHIHLFTSLLLSSIIGICWEVLVRYDRLTQDGEHSLLHRDQVSCKTLYVLLNYTRSTNYFWMLCEAILLHRVLVKAFSPPKHLIGFYIFGWGVPAILSVVYALLRKFIMDDNLCWSHLPSGSKAKIQWIIYVPTILCNVTSLLCLLNIIRILCRQLSSVSKEPSNYRKALRATFVLIPLFGIHQFIMIYRPNSNQNGFNVYQIISAIIINSQGIIISMIYCYFNGEVLSYLKLSWFRLKNVKKISESRKSLTSQTIDRRLSAISSTLNDIDIDRLRRLSVTQTNGHAPQNSEVDNIDMMLTNLKGDDITSQTNGHVNHACKLDDEERTTKVI